MRVASTKSSAATTALLAVLGSSSVATARPQAAAPAPGSGHVECSVAAISAIISAHSDAVVSFAELVAQDGSFGGAGQGNVAFPTNATGLPALCAVSVKVQSSPTSAYNFGVFLPDTTWNERFMATGNGGFGGGINWPDMGRMSKYGFASMSTDTGHSSNSRDGTWALNAPEVVTDWGYRAMHGSVVLAKEIVAGYYAPSSAGIKYSYYASCSTGGRQGLREVQLHPESFDGISVGAPAWWTTHLSSQTLWTGLLNYPPTAPHYITPELWPVIAAELIKQCDPQDGVVDGIISDPNGCNVDYEAMLCTSDAASSSSCLTPAQLTTLQKIHSDWVDEGQTFVFPGLSVGADPAIVAGEPNSLGTSFYRDMVYNDPEWDFTQLSYSVDVKAAEAANPGNATADDFAAIGRYQERGGKIIMYHGEADYLIPTRSSIYFYKQVQRLLQPQGVNLDDFYRFFLVPGMNHCFGSTGSGDAAVAPWYIAGGTQTLEPAGTYSVPGYADADHDVVMALVRWVEGDQAPDKIIASKFINDTAALGVERQRPLCVYPKQARYVGGDQDLAASWECALLY